MSDINNILINFSKIKCSIHKTKNYEHICSLDDCPEKHIIYCSQCLIDEQIHTQKHKTHFQQFDKYLLQKVNSLTGSALNQKIEELLLKENNLATNLEEKCNKIKHQIETDFNEIQGIVIGMCGEIKTQLTKSIDEYLKKNIYCLKDLEANLTQSRINLENQKGSILSEFEQILTNNFDFNNTTHVNSFIKKLKTKKTTFQVEQPINIVSESLIDLESNFEDTDYYNYKLVEQLKFYINDILEEPLQNNRFIDYIPNKSKKSYNENANSIFKTIDDKKSFLEYNNIEKHSIGYEASILTENKLSINSIAIIDSETFATSSNDQKVKVLGFTPNYVLFEKASLELDSLCMSIKYLKTQNLLFLALTNSTILSFNINNGLELVRTYEGHTRTVQQITLIPEKNIFLSISNDMTLKMFNINQEKEIFSQNLEIECKIIDANFDFCVLGFKNGCIRIFDIQDNAINQQVELIVSKDKITAITVSQINKQYAFIGSENGTVTIVDILKKEINYKFANLHKQRIFSINLFEGLQDCLYFVSYGWDNLAKLIKIDEKAIVSNSTFKHSYDAKKHWNTDGARLIYQKDGQYLALIIGNNDKSVEIQKIVFE